MNDYVNTMKNLLQEYYSPTPEGSIIEMQTSEVLRWFKGVIPNKPVTEHDVFDVLTELQFKMSQKILKEKKEIVKADKKKGIKAEYDDVEVGRLLVWNLYEKLD